MMDWFLKEQDKFICDDYSEDISWVRNSNNLCWGMGASAQIPCVNCGATYNAHLIAKYRTKKVEEQ